MIWRAPWPQLESAASSSGSDIEVRARAWRDATPFPHLVIDELIDPARFAELFAIVEDEPVERYVADLYAFDATAPEPKTAAFAQLRDDFAAALVPAIARVTGKRIARAEMRAYAYRAGDYLLPHADHRTELARQLAFAYYLPSPEPPEGGELELFRATDAAITSERVIAAVPNRIAVFDVGDRTLHQVREVTAGMRLSLAGWFYA